MTVEKYVAAALHVICGFLGFGPARLTDTESPSTHPQGEHLHYPKKSMPSCYDEPICVVSARKFTGSMDGLGVDDLDGTVD